MTEKTGAASFVAQATLHAHHLPRTTRPAAAPAALADIRHRPALRQREFPVTGSRAHREACTEGPLPTVQTGTLPRF